MANGNPLHGNDMILVMRLLQSLPVLMMMQLVVAAATLGDGAQTSTPLQERIELLQRGEAALARGDVGQALDAFERAGTMMHAADTEMGLVRTYMQSGAYRSALSFAAHTAGAHRDVPAGAVLYAWLLHAGGQTAFAQRVLDGPEARSPGDALVAQARAQLRSPAPVASGALLSVPWRVAPFDADASLPVTAHVACSAVLIDGGRRALAPLVEARALWLRDGLGRRSAARVERRVEPVGLVLLRLDHPIKGASGVALAPRDPFPGSAGFAVDYTAMPDATPAWPLLHSGFIGKRNDSAGLSRLGIAIPAGAQGGPVFDAGGRFTGIALRGADGQDRLLPVSVLRREFGELLGFGADQSAVRRAPADAIYENAMAVTLQVIADP
jgi:hypothetical protein